MTASITTFAPYLPWTDRVGRLSTLKLVIFTVAALPALSALYLALTGGYGPRPLTAAILDSGNHAVWLLLASLAVTPLRRIGNWPKLILVRRMLGLFALFYTLLHLMLFVAEKSYDLGVVATEIVLRFYLTIGFVAVLGFVALGLTSNEYAIKRLGAARWNRLHGLVYWIGVLSLVHFFLQSKNDVSKSLWAGGLFAILMGCRLLHRRKFALSSLNLIAMVAICALGTAAVEAAYYASKTPAPWQMIFLANFDTEMWPRPAVIVAMAGLCLAVVPWLRGEAKRPQPSPVRAVQA